MDRHREAIIKKQGYSLDSVPKEGDFVLIDYKSSASTGADTVEISAVMHSGYVELVEKIAAVSGNVPVLGVDIIANDFGVSPEESGYVVLEANIAPGLGGHIYPSYGNPASVIEDVYKRCCTISTRSGVYDDSKKYYVKVSTADKRNCSDEIFKSKLNNIKDGAGDKVLFATETELVEAFNALHSSGDFMPDNLLVEIEEIKENKVSAQTVSSGVYMNEEVERVRLIISGKVQGVGFRKWLQHEAKKNGVRGWVRNLSDGTVETVLHGEPSEVYKLISACLKCPGKSFVQNLKISKSSEALRRESFLRRKTLSV